MWDSNIHTCPSFFKERDKTRSILHEMTCLGGLTRWGRPGADAAKRLGHAAWKGSKARRKGAGALGAGNAVYGGGRFLIGKWALVIALKTCEKEHCVKRYRAKTIVKSRRFWFDKVECCCPDGGNLVDEFHAAR